MASVSSVFSGDENRFARSHPIGPVVATAAAAPAGAGCAQRIVLGHADLNDLVSLVLDIAQRPTNATRAPYQLIAAEVTKLSAR